MAAFGGRRLMMFGWFKKNVPPRTGPDFRPVDSLAKAQELVRAGQLQKMFLLPSEFGGEDIPPNWHAPERGRWATRGEV
jgi:hypothetical protein